jgi:hypothetical protein
MAGDVISVLIAGKWLRVANKTFRFSSFTTNHTGSLSPLWDKAVTFISDDGSEVYAPLAQVQSIALDANRPPVTLTGAG